MTRTAVYFAEDITAAQAAEVADALSLSANGRVVACDARRAIIETSDLGPDGDNDRDTETDYLHQLCDEDDRVTSYEVR